MEGLAVYVGCVGALVLGVLWRPAIALAALLMLFAIKQWGMAKVGAISSDWLFTNFVVGGIVILALGRALIGNRLKSPFTGDLSLIALLLYGYAAITLLWTPVPERALDELKTNIPYVLLTLAGMPMLVRRFEDATVGLWALVIIGTPLMAAFVFLASWEYRAIVNDFALGETVRLPLSLAQFAGMVFVVAALFLRGSMVRYAALAAVAALAVTIAIRTGSRGQFIAMVAAAGLFYPISRGNRSSLRMVVGLGICAALAVLAFYLYADTAVDIAASDDRWTTDEIAEDYEGRIDNSIRLLEVWASDPWYVVFGMGTSASFSSHLGGGYAHILPVDVLSELGLIGFSLLVILLWRCAAVVFAALRTVTRDPKHAARNPAIAAMVAIFAMDLLLAFKQGTLLRNSYLFMFPVMLQGILASEQWIRSRAQTRPLQPAGPPAPGPVPAPSQAPAWRSDLPGPIV